MTKGIITQLIRFLQIFVRKGGTGIGNSLAPKNTELDCGEDRKPVSRVVDLKTFCACPLVLVPLASWVLFKGEASVAAGCREL